MNGKGVILRSEKTPQYSPEQKKEYSKAQSATMGTAAYHPPVFNFGNSEQNLIGAMFLDKADFLLTNHLYTCDFGSEGRPSDFDDELSAEMYSMKLGDKIIFPSERVHEFRQAIESEEHRKKETPNECLIRLRWSANEKCKIFIHTDSFNTRILAQVQAKIIKQRLLAKHACPEDYEVSICYYKPRDPSIHLKEYTPEEQALDRNLAIQIANTPSFRQLKYATYSFEFLLALDKAKFDEVYSQDNTHADPLLGMMALRQNPHFNDFLVELGILNQDELNVTISRLFEFIKKEINELFVGIQSGIARDEDNLPAPLLAGTQNLVSILFVALSKNNQRLFDTIWDTLTHNPEILVLALQLNPNVGIFLIGEAISQTKNSHYLHKILELRHLINMDFNFVDEKGKSILHDAAHSSYSNHLRICLDAGCIEHINTQDKKGCTPLHYAAASGNMDNIQALLKVPGVDPTLLDKHNRSPLEAAIKRDQLTVVNYFLETLKLNPCSLNKQGHNILQLSLLYNAMTIFRNFIERDNRVSINTQDNTGDTILHTAVQLNEKEKGQRVNGIIQAIQILFSKGIKPYIRNKAGFTALDLARQQGDHDLIVGIVVCQIRNLSTKLDKLQNESGLKFQSRMAMINQLVASNSANDVRSGRLNIEVLDKNNSLVDTLLELDKLALEYIAKFSANKLSENACRKLQEKLDAAYQSVLVDGPKILDKMTKGAEALLREHLRPLQSIGGTQFGTFRHKETDSGAAIQASPDEEQKSRCVLQ